ATEKANQIISSSEVLKTRNLDNIQKQIDKADSYYLKTYEEVISKMHQESIKVFQNIPEYIKALLSKEVSDIKGQLFSGIGKTQEDARELILAAYKKVDQEVETYKKVRLDALDKSILNIVQEVSRKVLIREIDMNEHEKLVVKALEEAKKQNVFSSDKLEEGVEDSQKATPDLKTDNG
ncbi:hypothetical protein M1307_02130, partial [Patescibacteria group bacterium]|nr:hypothetical protein [Patescibacteria group bacterium]